jgi:hypothetical protein
MAIWRNRRPSGPQTAFWKQQGWIVSAVFIAAVFVFGAVGYVISQSDNSLSENEASAQTGPLSASAPRGAQGRPAGCTTDDSKTEMPTAAPIDVRWETVAGRKIPISVSAGPTKAEGSLMYCYARTPLGAAMAAQTITTAVRTKEWQTVLRQQVVAGKARDFYEAVYGGPADVVGNPLPGYLGFVVSEYTPEAATVRILLGSSAPSSTVMTSALYRTDVNLSWVDGDWKVQLDGGGDVTSTWETVSSSSGFLLWKV